MDVRAEADAALFGAFGDEFFQSGKGAAADEEDVGGVDVYQLLLRVFAPALRRYGGDGAFDQFEQRLLYAFAGDVAGNGEILAFARDFVDFVDVDDAFFGTGYVVVAVHQQFLHDGLDVFADVARFSQRGGIGNGKGDVQAFRQRLGEQGLAGTGRADHQDVAFDDFNAVVSFLLVEVQAFVVVVHRHRQRFFRAVLADDVVVQKRLDF